MFLRKNTVKNRIQVVGGGGLPDKTVLGTFIDAAPATTLNSNFVTTALKTEVVDLNRDETVTVETTLTTTVI